MQVTVIIKTSVSGEFLWLENHVHLNMMLGNVRVKGLSSSVVNKNEEMSHLGYGTMRRAEDHNIQGPWDFIFVFQKG